MEKDRFKKWLETKAEEEGLKIKVLFIRDDYTARVKKNGTITIPDCLFDKSVNYNERNAIGAHEIAHLKYKHAEKEEKWMDKIALHFALYLVFLIPPAVFLHLSGIDGTLSLVVLMAALFVIIVQFLRTSVPQFFDLKRLQEFEADKYAAETLNPTYLISYLEKSDEFIEKWKNKGFRWRANIWYGKKTHPPKVERIKRLKEMLRERKFHEK